MKTQLFIAAGGQGRRLGCAGPKSLVEVEGRPIIDRIIEAGLTTGFNSIVMGVDDGKEALIEHTAGRVNVAAGCVEPLTTCFFNAARQYQPDIIVGVNGDTLWHPASADRLLQALEQESSADGAVLITTVCRPFITSDWIYWRYRVENGWVCELEEVPGHEIPTLLVLWAFRTSSLERLSGGWVEDFRNWQNYQFQAYSLGWDYLVRLLLMRNFRILGLVGDDLCCNINTPGDLTLSRTFINEPGYYRWLTLCPKGSLQPDRIERSLILLKPEARRRGLEAELLKLLNRYGLNIVRTWPHRFTQAEAQTWYQASRADDWYEEAVALLARGESLAVLVAGRGGYYRALCWKKEARRRYAISATNNLVHSTYSPWSFDCELERELAIIGPP
ncbi:MAG: nucleoside-diphosphate kinase [Patescibacteria group bacterium]